ncbi:MAG: type IX secretion system membrane protein PorP/SprF [Bacteroidales bacterium]
MSIKKTKELIIMLLLSCVSALAQQNIQFTQYMFNTLSINPAYAGYKEQLFLQMTYRSQWVSMVDPPQTMQVSVDGITNNPNKQVGLGLQLTTDKLGPQSSTSLYANYAYRIQLDEEDSKRLCFGLGAGITQYGLDETKILTNTPNDPVFNNTTLTNYVPDIRFGIYYYTSKWYLGMSVLDMLANTVGKSILSLDKMNIIRNPHFYLVSGILFEVNDFIKFRPSVLVKEDFKGPTCFDLSGLIVYKNRFGFGGTYRTGINTWPKEYGFQSIALKRYNTIAGIIQFELSDALKLVYSYDYAINGLQVAQFGSHEITLGWTIPTKSQRLLSPRFF